MIETVKSGLMRGLERIYGGASEARQKKETEQIGFTYGTPRQSSTLPLIVEQSKLVLLLPIFSPFFRSFSNKRFEFNSTRFSLATAASSRRARSLA